ncbi:hypothetical protein LTR99_001817 [Exophiala xenobiotica]|uniref:HD domain-containing protein n=1 Tax=Vermiconidia calcicola TaxID=1690605 RepID=A0AAV9Q8V6_9PEZI|nr:hypothetical protein LTR92_010466 [Exophiala xenobiotica]KAK5536585.1 hypothetical protein LTR25_005259 [Vermiconidia calcicola]KAK5543274.1 hypothetical protein LTR23_004751 [Chaetothyriales sp. CCFEE 6169]KAK5272425.1 hypothetical protein LTR96_002055 [Exophiala xenobiotica]KAK5306127.1 hypothetical protein LTR99_001817 [Exophiala xenobiotica]
MATNPLFTAKDEKRVLGNISVFPDLLANSAFLYALVYSMVLSWNSWECSIESLYLKGSAIERLHENLRKSDVTSQALSACTMLMLGHAACRSGEYTEYAAHSEGLYRLVKACNSSGAPLPDDILRAVFWHDVACTGIIDGAPRFSKADFPALFDQNLPLTHKPDIDAAE